MTAATSFGYNARERAQKYTVLASMFRLSPESIPPDVLYVLPPDQTDELLADQMASREQMAEWLDSGDTHTLCGELAALFGGEPSSKALPVLPACEASFAEDPDRLRSELDSLWQECAFEPAPVPSACDGPGYIGHELEFLAHCLELSAEDSGWIGVAEKFARDHLMPWAPLFAAALERASSHPGVRFLADALEHFLGDERDLLDGALFATN